VGHDVAAEGVEERLGADRLQREGVERHRLPAEVPGGEDLAVVVDEVGVGGVLEREAAGRADGVAGRPFSKAIAWTMPSPSNQW
jgi:hypothetical protein